MIAESIFAWAEKVPDRTAVIYNGTALSYGKFAHIIAMARGYFMRHTCAGPGIAVLAVHNLMDLWTFGLALRSLGLTTIALPSVAAIRSLNLPDVSCVVTSSTEKWPDLDTLCATKGLNLFSVSLRGEKPVGLDGAQPGGHILRTSGTTGREKFVLMSSAIDQVMLRRKVELIGMNHDTVLCVFNFKAWTGVGYRWAASPWIAGGATLIEQSPQRHRALLRPGLTHAVLVPRLLASVLEAPDHVDLRNEKLMLVVGGAAMSRAQAEKAKSRITPRLFNFLASTEAGAIALTPLDSDDDHRWHLPAAGRSVEVVDDCDRPVPVGSIGRLRIAAAGGPTHYLHDEAASQTFFKENYFYTGDLAVMRADGRIALQGRFTDVINLEGQKVSPFPIEDQLCEMLGVNGVCLFSADSAGSTDDVHIIIEAAMPIDPEKVRAAVHHALRGFRGARVHYAAELPRNEMGKVLRREVRARFAPSS